MNLFYNVPKKWNVYLNKVKADFQNKFEDKLMEVMFYEYTDLEKLYKYNYKFTLVNLDNWLSEYNVKLSSIVFTAMTLLKGKANPVHLENLILKYIFTF